jgi:hypothetical protein
MENKGAGEEVGGDGTGSMNRGARIEMRLAGKTITVLLVMILMMAPMAVAQQQPAPEMSYRQAQRAIMTAMQYAVVMEVWSYLPVDQSSIRLTQVTLEFDAKGEHFAIPLKGLRKLTSSDCWEYNCRVEEEGRKSWFLAYYNAKKKRAELLFGAEKKGKICSQAQNHDECMNAAAQFAAALNSLHIYALRPMPPDEDFHKQAATWRALAEKPALPDAVRVRRMMAEDAIKNKKPEDALTFYERTPPGLKAGSTLPWWPENWAAMMSPLTTCKTIWNLCRMRKTHRPRATRWRCGR